MNKYVNRNCYLSRSQASLNSFLDNKNNKNPKRSMIAPNISIRINRLQSKIGKQLSPRQIELIKSFYKEKTKDYGFYKFVLEDNMGWSIEESSFKELVSLGILSCRERKYRSGRGQSNFYYLDNPILVNRKEYLEFENKIYEFKKGGFSR